MCDLATIGLVVSAGGGLASAYQQNQIGKSNAAFARAQAEQEREIGNQRENVARSRMERLIERQQAQLAARGVRLDSTSAQRLGAEAAGQSAIEAQASRFNTQSKVNALNTEAELSESRGKLGFIRGVAKTGASALTRSLDLWPDMLGAT